MSAQGKSLLLHGRTEKHRYPGGETMETCLFNVQEMRASEWIDQHEITVLNIPEIWGTQKEHGQKMKAQ